MPVESEFQFESVEFAPWPRRGPSCVLPTADPQQEGGSLIDPLSNVIVRGVTWLRPRIVGEWLGSYVWTLDKKEVCRPLG